MKSLTINSLRGESIKMQLPDPGNYPSFFAFSLHKAGSTLLFNMLNEAMSEVSFPVVDISSKVFEKGMNQFFVDDSINKAFKPWGYAYLGWRFFPYTTHFDHSKVKNILLIRDPRDILVSIYFSIAQSHILPEVGEMRDTIIELRKDTASRNIDEWVFDKVKVMDSSLGNWPAFFINQFERYLDFLPEMSTRIYRYEDVIFRKRECLEDMMGYLDLKLPKASINRIADRFDIRPQKELPDQHIRQVTPGNYKKHFNPDTIDKLNRLFGNVLVRFGYNQSSDFGSRICFSEKSLDNQKYYQDSCETVKIKNFNAHKEDSALFEENKLLYKVCNERLELINRLHNEAAILQELLKKNANVKEK